MNGKNGDQTLLTHLGTKQYMAPEIHLDQPYRGKQVDLFAAGIVLFILVTGHPPFNLAVAKDRFYKALAKGQNDIFWLAHEKQTQNLSFSNEFKDLIQ